MVTNFSNVNSLVSVWMSELRDVNVQKDRMRFRKNMERIGEIAAYEISKVLTYQDVAIQTPLATAICAVPEQQPILVSIMRAGIPLYQGLLNFFDQADSAFIGAYRKHAEDGSFEIDQQYMASPPMDGRPLILADPMLATGASMVLALNSLLEHDHPSQIHIVAAIASAAGIALVTETFPDAYIWVGAIDEELSAKKYIVPGLGDAGDLAFGQKRQA